MAHRDTGLYFDAEARAMSRRDRDLIPRRLIIAVFSLALASVLLVAFAVLTERPLVGQPKTAPVVAERTLTITGDRPSVTIVNAETGETLVSKDNGGFLSVVNDGLIRARYVARVDGNPPVTLTLYENSRLSLHDPASGWRTEISSFGPGNVGVWLKLLKEK